MTALKPDAAESTSKLILFLDLDDVCILNSQYGGYDVALALTPTNSDGRHQPADATEMWRQLVAPQAGKLLRQIHDEFRPQYVLTTSWWWLMSDETLREALRLAGLEFVESNLHPDMATPKGARPDVRWSEIKNWLNAHPECAERWVVLDDELSGTGLTVKDADERRPFIVLCAKDVGLTEAQYQQLRTGFLLRSQG